MSDRVIVHEGREIGRIRVIGSPESHYYPWEAVAAGGDHSRSHRFHNYDNAVAYLMEQDAKRERERKASA